MMIIKRGVNMVEIKDEILDGEPLYDIKDSDGNIIYKGVKIELITALVQQGTPLNKALFDIIMPSGLICMWSGTQIPKGWYLCDGTNGTPDLRNRFIVGAGSGYTVGNTGGSDKVTVTKNQLPAHTHNIKIHGDVSAYSTNKNDTDGTGDTHGYVLGTHGGSSKLCIPGKNNDTQDLRYDFTIETMANSGGEAIENRPPYYALAYIMKA
jgi:microcystin-dependent protein